MYDTVNGEMAELSTKCVGKINSYIHVQVARKEKDKWQNWKPDGLLLCTQRKGGRPNVCRACRKDVVFLQQNMAFVILNTVT